MTDREKAIKLLKECLNTQLTKEDTGDMEKYMEMVSKRHQLAEAALAALEKPAVCETIKVFDIDMTLEQVLQNVLINIQEQQKTGHDTNRDLGYAETYCQAAYDFVRAKPTKPTPTGPALRVGSGQAF